MKYLYIAFFMAGGMLYSQSTVTFGYDEAGNQKLRQLTCINCTTPSAGRVASSNIVEDETQNEIVSKQITYYPNPVLEQLSIDWVNEKDKYLKRIEVYSMSGQLIMTKKDIEGKQSTLLEFGNMSEGIFNVILVYNTGESKIIKVVKK